MPSPHGCRDWGEGVHFADGFRRYWPAPVERVRGTSPRTAPFPKNHQGDTPETPGRRGFAPSATPLQRDPAMWRVAEDRPVGAPGIDVAKATQGHAVTSRVLSFAEGGHLVDEGDGWRPSRVKDSRKRRGWKGLVALGGRATAQVAKHLLAKQCYPNALHQNPLLSS